jgi:putative integral membrane protein (TIGR02587 family)
LARGAATTSTWWTGADRVFLKGLARAFAGALIFALPMLMTMEMWQLGFVMEPLKLALLLVVLVPLLTGMSMFGGFKASFGWLDDVIDAFVAIAISSLAAAIVLAIFGVISFDMALDEVIGKIAIQAVAGSIGAMLARSQLAINGHDACEERKRHPTYSGELFLMAVGALFLSLNVAPTEEVILIAYQMEPRQEVALAVLSLLLMHGFVYAIGFRGQHEVDELVTFWSVFLRFTAVGYAIVLAVSVYMLWTFGRTSGMPVDAVLSTAIVLGFPGAIGAAAARLVV